MGNDLTKGTTYIDGGTINAANLNAHVDDAELKYTAINARTAKTPIAITDEFLINDGGTLKKATGQAIYNAIIQPGTVIQSTYGTYTANADLTAIIPQDDTIPQIGEGTQIITLSFTPRFTNSRMVLRFSGIASVSNINNALVSIFRSPNANAIGAGIIYQHTAAVAQCISVFTTDLPATASTLTYTVRAGPSAAGTLRFNGTSGTRYFGGVMATTLEVQEIFVS